MNENTSNFSSQPSEELRAIARESRVFDWDFLQSLAEKLGGENEFCRDFFDATRIDRFRVGSRILLSIPSILLLSDVRILELTVADVSAEYGFSANRSLRLIMKDGKIFRLPVSALDSFLMLSKALLSRGIALRCTNGTDEKEWTEFSPVAAALAWYGCFDEAAEHADLLTAAAAELETSSNCCARQCAAVLRGGQAASAPLSGASTSENDEELLEQVRLRLAANTMPDLESAMRLLGRVSFAADSSALRVQVNEALMKKRRELEEERKAQEERERIALEQAEAKRKAAIRSRRLKIAAAVVAAAFIVFLYLRNNAIKKERYEAAMGLYNAGDYSAALSAFLDLDGFSDSAALLKDCKLALVREGDITYANEMGKDISDLDQQLEYCAMCANAGLDLNEIYPDGVVVNVPMGKYQYDEDAPGFSMNRVLVFSRQEKAEPTKSFYWRGEVTDGHDKTDDSIYTVKLLPGALYALPEESRASSWEDCDSFILLDSFYDMDGVIQLKTTTNTKTNGRVTNTSTSYSFYAAYAAVSLVEVFQKDNPAGVVFESNIVNSPEVNKSNESYINVSKYTMAKFDTEWEANALRKFIDDFELNRLILTLYVFDPSLFDDDV